MSRNSSLININPSGKFKTGSSALRTLKILDFRAGRRIGWFNISLHEYAIFKNIANLVTRQAPCSVAACFDIAFAVFLFSERTYRYHAPKK